MTLNAATANLPASPLTITADPTVYRPHVTHDPARMWPETNCYFDLWIEVLHGLNMDPVLSFACLLSADHDGFQWDFVKPPPEDLRRLYGLEVTEENVWLPLLDTVESGPTRALLHTVEVDSWWLPDTAGTAYRSQHVKTTIVPTRVDRQHRVMWYLHNAGLFELRDEDFDGVFGLADAVDVMLPPYVEQVRSHPERIEPDALATIVVEHLARRPATNPISRLASGVLSARDWLPNAGIEMFHRWAFATLRQCGATAEMIGDLVGHLDTAYPGAGEARERFWDVAAGAKSVQFKMARAAAGRTANVEPGLEAMAASWQQGMDIVTRAVG